MNGEFPRLSDRFSVNDLSFTFTVPNARKLFGKKSAQLPMRVVDLSVAGALVLGPHLETIRTGTRVQFIHNGQQGSAEVRHVRPTQDVPGMTDAAYYGLVFINLTEDMKGLIFDQMSVRRGKKDPELNDLWNHAR